MSKYALILGGVVDAPPREWIEEVDEEPGHWGEIRPKWISVTDNVFAGFIANPDGTFSAEPALPGPVPESVTARQFKMQLSISGLKAAVDA